MKQTKLIMGMPITVEIVDKKAESKTFKKVFDYFRQVDARFSTYKKDSEISQINRGLPKKDWSAEMKKVLKLCEDTRKQTAGYFDISRNGQLDSSGLVKGWAINNAAKLLTNEGVRDFYVEAGGDVQVSGTNQQKQPWVVGIRNPFNRAQIIKTVTLTTQGLATSGTYVRGQHIYNPHKPKAPIKDVASLSVIGPNIYEADRFATAAFAMGKKGIDFIESLNGFEAYMVDSNQMATLTSGFERYVVA